MLGIYIYIYVCIIIKHICVCCKWTQHLFFNAIYPDVLMDTKY